MFRRILALGQEKPSVVLEKRPLPSKVCLALLGHLDDQAFPGAVNKSANDRIPLNSCFMLGQRSTCGSGDRSEELLTRILEALGCIR